jgi:hypothetical protein
MSGFPQILVWLSSNVFAILSAVAGITVACVLWSRAPRAAMLLLAASVLQLLVLAITTWFYMFFLPYMADFGGDARQAMIWSGLVAGLLHAVIYGLMIWAVATDRRQRMAPPPVVSRG